MYIVLAILVFGLIVAIHELGHFFAAKAFKIGVVEYAIGMGPMLFGKRIGETVYSLRAIPFGGYCAMYGEESLEAGDKGKEDKEKNKETKQKKPKVEFKKDWTSDRSYNSKAPWKRILVLLAGPFANLVLGFVMIFTSITLWGSFGPLTIKEVKPDTPAYEAGIEANDLITKINNRNVLTYNDFFEYKLSHPSVNTEGYTLTVERNGESKEFFVVPDPETEIIGIIINTEVEKKSFPDIIKYSFNDMKYWIVTVFDSIGMLINGDATAKDLSGAIGITDMMGDTMKEASDYGSLAVIETIMTLIAFISINLGIMNLLPFPALDGGRIAFTSIELLTRKKIPVKIEFAVNAVGMLCLMGLMIFTLFNDVIRIIFN